MKTAFKIVLGCLISVTLALVAFTVYTASQITPEKPQMQELFDLSLDLNFFWGYALFALAILGVVIAFFFNIVSHPSGLIKTLLGLVVVVAVVGTAFGLVLSHELLPVPNSAGGVFDNPFELKISAIGLYVTYIVAAIAILAVFVDMCGSVVRRFIK